MELITSPANPLVKRLVALQRPAGRREQGRFLAEGERIIDGFLRGGWQPQGLYLQADRQPPAGWAAHREPIGLAARVLRKVSQVSTAPGLLAEFAIPAPPEHDPAAGGLVLADLADPGNVGTLLRSAAAFGLRQVLLLGGVDPYGAKVVQASAGALARLRLRRAAADAPLPAGHCVALDAHAGLPPGGFTVDPQHRPWIVVGSEAHGLTPVQLEQCATRLHLPMVDAVESLNAGVAGAIGCFLAAGLHR